MHIRMVYASLPNAQAWDSEAASRQLGNFGVGASENVE